MKEEQAKTPSPTKTPQIMYLNNFVDCLIDKINILEEDIILLERKIFISFSLPNAPWDTINLLCSTLLPHAHLNVITYNGHYTNHCSFVQNVNNVVSVPVMPEWKR